MAKTKTRKKSLNRSKAHRSRAHRSKAHRSKAHRSKARRYRRKTIKCPLGSRHKILGRKRSKSGRITRPGHYSRYCYRK